jgi:hypothetical protein
VNCTEDIMTVTRLKRVEEKKRWSEVRERKSFDEEIEDDISTRKIDRGQLSNKKKIPLDSLENHMERKEIQARKGLKTRVKFWYLGF